MCSNTASNLSRMRTRPQDSNILFRKENTDSYLKRFTPGRFDTVSLRIKHYRVNSLSKQDQNTVHNAHDQMRWFGKLTDRGDMAGLDGLVTNKHSQVRISRQRHNMKNTASSDELLNLHCNRRYMDVYFT